MSAKKKSTQSNYPKCLILLARLGGFEPPTYGLEVRCSIPLSYRRLSEMRNYSCTFHLSRGLSLAQQSLELSGLFHLDIPKLFQNVQRFSIESDLLFVLLVDEGKGFKQVTVNDLVAFD